MYETSAQSAAAMPVESVLRDELAHGDALVGTIAPILRHLLANDEHSVFNDEIIARVRGILADLARQLLDELAVAEQQSEPVDHSAADIDGLIDKLVAHAGFLAHVHALALEWQLTDRLQARLALDPVLSPLLQALIASPDHATASVAMGLLAAQARFGQGQRRMQLPLTELPGDLLHVALLALRHHAGDSARAQESCAISEASIRARYDESRSRLGLIARIVAGMGGGATAALSVTHAGAAIFITALALASGQDRDMAVLCANEGQLARFALALRAAGLKPMQIAEQFAAIHPEVALPAGFEQIGPDRAAALLARSAAYPGL